MTKPLSQLNHHELADISAIEIMGWDKEDKRLLCWNPAMRLEQAGKMLEKNDWVVIMTTKTKQADVRVCRRLDTGVPDPDDVEATADTLAWAITVACIAAMRKWGVENVEKY